MASEELAMATEELAMACEELAMAYEELAKDHEELNRDSEELTMAVEELTRFSEELTSLPSSRADSTIYTLSSSADVAEGLASGYKSMGTPLCDEELLAEFEDHAFGKLTIFVSLSKRVTDTLQGAVDRCRRNESPADVWIIFVEVPANDTREDRIRVHSADELAARCGHPNPQKFRHEAVVEWEIPRSYVSHRVNLQTLMNRDIFRYLDQPVCRPGPPPQWEPPEDVRSNVIDVLTTRADGPWKLGVLLASFAMAFGARAPIKWIATQLFGDCLILNEDGREYEIDDGAETASLGWSEIEIELIGEGMDALVSSWLADSDFVQAYKKFQGMAAAVRRLIHDWHMIYETFSEQDRIAFRKKHREISADLKHRWENVEGVAVQMGL